MSYGMWARRRPGAAMLAAAVASLWAAAPAQAQEGPVYKDTKAPLEARVKDLFGRLTQDEKLSFLTGTAFTTQAIPRLGVPAMSMVDAGQGVRGGMDSTIGPATLFPSGVTMASTWDTELVGRIGFTTRYRARLTDEDGTGAELAARVIPSPDVLDDTYVPGLITWSD